jgi:hypothetical protein
MNELAVTRTSVRGDLVVPSYSWGKSKPVGVSWGRQSARAGGEGGTEPGE